MAKPKKVSQDDDTGKKTGPARGRKAKELGEAPSSKRRAQQIAAEDQDDQEGGEDEAGDEKAIVRWDDDEDLSWKLISTINDDPKIKRGLFPPPGANPSTQQGGGKRKTEFYWAICVALFTDHPEYGGAFKRVGTKDKKLWQDKIKNRLRNMQKATRKGIEALRATGAGISHANDINMAIPNEFTNKWEEVRAEAPWFFEMRELMGQRPNSNPVGLGNSTTLIQNDAILPSSLKPEDACADVNASGLTSVPDVFDRPRDVFDGPRAGVEMGADDSGAAAVTMGGSGLDLNSSSDEDPFSDAEVSKPAVSGTKRKATPSVQASTKKPRASAPTASTLKAAKKHKAIADFEEIAKAEEVTRQQELKVQEAKARVEVAKIQAKADVKKDKERNKLELRKFQLAQEYQFKLEQFRILQAPHAQYGPFTTFDNFTNTGSINGGMYSDSTPSTSISAAIPRSHSSTPFNSVFTDDDESLHTSASATGLEYTALNHNVNFDSLAAKTASDGNLGEGTENCLGG